MLFFVTALHWDVSSGGAGTLAIMVLPLIMRTAEEALKAFRILSEKEVSDLGPESCVQSLLLYFHQQFLESYRNYLSNRTYRRRDGSTYFIHQVQLQNPCKSYGIRAYTGASHVCIIQRGYSYQSGICDSGCILLIVVLIINGVSSVIAKRI